jgi:hypothetical protein
MDFKNLNSQAVFSFVRVINQNGSKIMPAVYEFFFFFLDVS